MSLIAEKQEQMTRHDLSVRVTHKYASGWAYLDDWESIGKFSVLSSGELSDHNGAGEGTTTVTIVEVSRNDRIKDADVERALHHVFSQSSCQHEHDCCGCLSYYAQSVHQMNDDDDYWVIVVKSYPNY